MSAPKKHFINLMYCYIIYTPNNIDNLYNYNNHRMIVQVKTQCLHADCTFFPLTKSQTQSPIPTDFLDNWPPGLSRDKSAAYLSRADSDTLAKPSVAELNG